MSTARRPLGTGPNTTAPIPAGDIALRLLPAERIEPDVLLADADDDQNVPVVRGVRGRRPLSTGPATD